MSAHNRPGLASLMGPDGGGKAVEGPGGGGKAVEGCGAGGEAIEGCGGETVQGCCGKAVLGDGCCVCTWRLRLHIINAHNQ